MSNVTDSFFHIGEQHVQSGLPCEDYALAHAHGDMAYAIVSDGCSSGGRTDVGARVLAHATARALLLEWEQPFSQVNDVFLKAIEMRTECILGSGRELLALDTQDMLATSVLAMVSPRGGCARVFGDGVVGRMYKDGTAVLSLFSWHENMPYYPAYTQGALEAFVSAHGGDISSVRLTEERVTIRDTVCTTETIPYSLGEGIRGVSILIPEHEISTLVALAVFSDGVTQIEGVHWVDTVQQFLAFRSTTGAFVKRRMIRQLKEYVRSSRRSFDDIAGAVIVQSGDHGS